MLKNVPHERGTWFRGKITLKIKLMKKLFAILILGAACLGARAQYQLLNGDFETWTYDGVNLPNNWNSFQTADGVYKGTAYSSSNRQVARAFGHNGNNDSHSVVIWARSVAGVAAQGNLTTGRVHAASMTAASSDNHNYSDRDGQNTNNGVINPCAMSFSGLPDAISVWVRYVPADESSLGDYNKARFSCVLHDDFDYIKYGLPAHDNNDNKSHVVAEAEKEFEACEWTNYIVNFTYTGNDDVRYVMFNASSNAYPGKGSFVKDKPGLFSKIVKADSLYVDDIELIYNSSLNLEKCHFKESALSFIQKDGEDVMTINEPYEGNESELVLISDGKGATIRSEYNKDSALLTIVVEGNNITEDSNNYHKYKIQFATSATLTVKSAAQYGTFCAPFDVTIPDGVKAYTISGIDKNGKLVLEQQSAISAHTPVIVESTSDVNAVQFGVATEGEPKSAYLTGVYTATPAPVGSYVLQNQNGRVGFYQVQEGKQPTVGANRAYLDLTNSPAGVKAFYIDDATAIQAVEELLSGKAEIYDLAGRRLQKLQKGINIIGGKKVLVK